MHIDANAQEARAILGAMLAVAQAGPAVTDADRASIAAAARYIFRLDLPPGLAALRRRRQKRCARWRPGPRSPTRR
jgi:hypothetical protein